MLLSQIFRSFYFDYGNMVNLVSNFRLFTREVRRDLIFLSVKFNNDIKHINKNILSVLAFITQFIIMTLLFIILMINFILACIS